MLGCFTCMSHQGGQGGQARERRQSWVVDPAGLHEREDGSLGVGVNLSYCRLKINVYFLFWSGLCTPSASVIVILGQYCVNVKCTWCAGVGIASRCTRTRPFQLPGREVQTQPYAVVVLREGHKGSAVFHLCRLICDMGRIFVLVKKENKKIYVCTYVYSARKFEINFVDWVNILVLNLSTACWGSLECVRRCGAGDNLENYIPVTCKFHQQVWIKLCVSDVFVLRRMTEMARRW